MAVDRDIPQSIKPIPLNVSQSLFAWRGRRSMHKPRHSVRARRFVVIGASGLIGSKTVERLRQREHEAVAGSPKSARYPLPGEGLADGHGGAQVVGHGTKSPSFEGRAVLEFFETSGRNLLAA